MLCLVLSRFSFPTIFDFTMSAFCVVSFTATHEVAVVPSNWVKQEFCYWPPKKLQGRILPLIPKGITAADTWNIYHIHLLGTFDTYSDARQKLQKAEDKSDLNTTDPEDCGRGKREKREKRISSSESDESTLTDYPLFPIISAKEGEQIKTVGQSSISFKKQKVNQDNSSEVTEIENFSPSLLSSNIEENCVSKSQDFAENIYYSSIEYPNKRGNECAGFHKAVLRDLNIVKTNQRAILESLNALHGLINNSERISENVKTFNNCSDEKSELKEILEMLPICNIMDLKSLEEKLGDQVVYCQMVDYLNKIGGGTIQFGIKMILKRLFTDALATKFSFFGVRGKEAFNTLKLCGVIYDTVWKNSLWKNTKEIEINKIIMDWLRHAKERCAIKEKNLKL